MYRKALRVHPSIPITGEVRKHKGCKQNSRLSVAVSCSRPASGCRCGRTQDTLQHDVVSVPGDRGKSSHKVGPQATRALIIAKAGQENNIDTCTGCTNRVLPPQKIKQ